MPSTILRELSSDLQVIYLTTSERYDALADRVVVLAGPTARDTGPFEADEEPAGPADASSARPSVPVGPAAAG